TRASTGSARGFGPSRGPTTEPWRGWRRPAVASPSASSGTPSSARTRRSSGRSSRRRNASAPSAAERPAASRIGLVPYRKVVVRACRTEDEGLLFGLASLAFSGQDEGRTLTKLSHDTVFVPALEGEGVARQLLDWVEGFAISRGARTLQVVVEPDNARARAFYTGRGYAPADSDLLERALPGS